MGVAVPGGGFLGRMILAGAAKGPAAVGRWSWFTSALEVTIQDAGIIWDLCASKWPAIWSLNLFEHLKIRENALRNSMNFLVTETNEISTFWYLSLITGLCLSHSSLFLSHDHSFIMVLLDTVLLVKSCHSFFFSQHWCEHENPDEPETDVSWVLCQCGQALQHSESAVLLALCTLLFCTCCDRHLWCWLGDWTQTQQEVMLQQEDPRLPEHKDCESKKQRESFVQASCLEAPAGAGLVLLCLWGILCECGACREPGGDPLGVWSCHCKGASVPALTVWGGATVTQEWHLKGQTGKFP